MKEITVIPTPPSRLRQTLINYDQHIVGINREKKMSNELDQHPDATLQFLEILAQETKEHLHTPRCVFQAARQGIKLIKYQQSRIELLESVIRDFVYKPDSKNILGENVHVETLRNLMWNK